MPSPTDKRYPSLKGYLLSFLVLQIFASGMTAYADTSDPDPLEISVLPGNMPQTREAAPTAPAGQFNVIDGANIDETLIVDKLIRKTIVHLPGSWQENQQLPLVIVLHGAKLTPKIAEVVTGFDKIANKENFIVAYPEAIHHQWNDGRKAWANPSYGIDDVKFMARLITYLVGKYNVNPRRIYVAGYSSGGMLAQRLAMEMTDQIAAIAEVASTLPVPQLELKERPARPISVMMINGTQDPAFPWEGGDTRIIGITVGNVASVKATVDYWVSANGGLTDKPDFHPATPFEKTQSSKKDTTLVDVTYFPTKNNTSVMLYTIIGGGHTWPGSDVPLHYIPFLGRESKKLKASELIWEFFSHY